MRSQFKGSGWLGESQEVVGPVIGLACVEQKFLVPFRAGDRRRHRVDDPPSATRYMLRDLIDGAAMRFHFKGKSGVEHDTGVRDARLARVLKTLRELPGQHLFKYRDEAGEWREVGSDDVNAYLRDIAGEDFSAKDFRTWAGTVSAARALRDMEPATSVTDLKRKTNLCVKAVAGLLGNTPTVCRASYVHPAIFKLFEDGSIRSVLPGSDTLGFEKAVAKVLARA